MLIARKRWFEVVHFYNKLKFSLHRFLVIYRSYNCNLAKWDCVKESNCVFQQKELLGCSHPLKLTGLLFHWYFDINFIYIIVKYFYNYISAYKPNRVKYPGYFINSINSFIDLWMRIVAKTPAYQDYLVKLLFVLRDINIIIASPRTFVFHIRSEKNEYIWDGRIKSANSWIAFMHCSFWNFFPVHIHNRIL